MREMDKWTQLSVITTPGAHLNYPEMGQEILPGAEDISAEHWQITNIITQAKKWDMYSKQKE